MGDSRRYCNFKVWVVVNFETDAPCTLSVSNLPPLTTGVFDDSVIEPPYTDTSILSIATADATPENIYTIFISTTFGV